MLGENTQTLWGSEVSVAKAPVLYRVFTREGVLTGLAIFYLSTVWIPAMSAAVLLLAHIQSWWILAGICSILSLAVLWILLFHHICWGDSLLLGTVVLASLAVAAGFSIFFYDVAYDSRWYHTDAILGLLRGVNPIYDRFSAPIPMFSNHYPKAGEYFAALMIHIFHNFQLGKIYNLLLVYAVAAYSTDLFLRIGLRGRPSLILSWATALSPVSASQLATYYVDGALGSSLALIVIGIVNVSFYPRRCDRLLLILAASLALAIKFTGVPYVAILLLILSAMGIVGRTERILTDAGTAAYILCLGVLLLGFNPYVTNLRQGLQPLYPIMGPHKVAAAIGAPTPSKGHSYNRLQRLAISFFSRTEVYRGRTAAPAPSGSSTLKIPFTVSFNELIGMGRADARVGGWGILFSGVTVLSLLLFFILKGWRGHPAVLLALALITVTTVLNPACWWARFVPQSGLWPVFLLFPCLRNHSAFARIAASALACALLLNNLLLAGAGAGASLYIKEHRLDSPFAALVRAQGAGEYWAYRSSNPRSGRLHVDQFSGHRGIVICGEIDPPSRPLPSGGFPIGLSKDVEATLFKGNCSQGPPQMP